MPNYVGYFLAHSWLDSRQCSYAWSAIERMPVKWQRGPETGG
jgi:hypothetical protein